MEVEMGYLHVPERIRMIMTQKGDVGRRVYWVLRWKVPSRGAAWQARSANCGRLWQHRGLRMMRWIAVHIEF